MKNPASNDYEAGFFSLILQILDQEILLKFRASLRDAKV